MDANSAKPDLFKELKQEVYSYLEAQKLSIKRTPAMVAKASFLALLWCFSYWAFLHFGQISPTYAILLTLPWTATMLVIQLAVMHDGSHGASSDSVWVNRLLTLSISFLGGSALLWKAQHCQAHHSFTNIHGYDHDIDTHGILRLHPSQALENHHKYQQLYAWALYPLFVLSWVWWGDLRDIIDNTYSLSAKKMKSVIYETIIVKIWHIFMFLVVPTVAFGSFGLALTCYLICFSILGLFMVVIFQLAHVTGVQNLPVDPTENEKNWLARQVSTTANFATQNGLLTWCTGGLNYQVEHHLFPTMSHLNYAKIQPIVEKFCRDHNMPYYSHPSVASAIAGHQHYLKAMGQPS